MFTQCPTLMSTSWHQLYFIIFFTLYRTFYSAIYIMNSLFLFIYVWLSSGINISNIIYIAFFRFYINGSDCIKGTDFLLLAPLMTANSASVSYPVSSLSSPQPVKVSLMFTLISSSITLSFFSLFPLIVSSCISLLNQPWSAF